MIRTNLTYIQCESLNPWAWSYHGVESMPTSEVFTGPEMMTSPDVMLNADNHTSPWCVGSACDYLNEDLWLIMVKRWRKTEFPGWRESEQSRGTTHGKMGSKWTCGSWLSRPELTMRIWKQEQRLWRPNPEEDRPTLVSLSGQEWEWTSPSRKPLQ